MTTRWVTPDGARVDVITLTGTSEAGGTRRNGEECGDGQWLRVTGPRGNYAGKTRTPTGLARLGIDLAGLTPVQPRETSRS